MTPNEIDILLHYHTSPTEHPRIHAPAVQEAIEMFITFGILRPMVSPCATDLFITTEKGKALVSLLCNVDFPVQVWADKDGKVIEYD